jgi:hypothetical protein
MRVVSTPMLAAIAAVLALLLSSCSTGDPVNETAGTAFAPTTAAPVEDDGGFVVEAQAKRTQTLVVGEPTDLAEFCDRAENAYGLAAADPVDAEAYGAALAYAQEAIPESVASHISKHFDSVIAITNTYDELPAEAADESSEPADDGVEAEADLADDEPGESTSSDTASSDTPGAEDAPTELSAQDRLRTASAPLGETVLGGLCGRDYAPL